MRSSLQSHCVIKMRRGDTQYIQGVSYGSFSLSHHTNRKESPYFCREVRVSLTWEIITSLLFPNCKLFVYSEKEDYLVMTKARCFLGWPVGVQWVHGAPTTGPGSDTLMPQNITLHFSTLIFACRCFEGRVGVLRWLLLPPSPSSLCRLVFAQEMWSTPDTGHGCVCPQRNWELLGVGSLELQLPLCRWLIQVPCKTALQTCTKKQEWKKAIVFLLKSTLGQKCYKESWEDTVGTGR